MPLQADLDGDGIVTADEMAVALKLDHDGDGVIDVDLDLDGDGIVSATELKLALKADKDGDGMLTQAELVKAQQAPGKRRDHVRRARTKSAALTSLAALPVPEAGGTREWPCDAHAKPLAALFFGKRSSQMLASLQQREERLKRAEELARAAAKIMEDEGRAGRLRREATMTSAERMLRQGGKQKKRPTKSKRKTKASPKKKKPPPPLETSLRVHTKAQRSPLQRDRANKARTWAKAASTLLERFDDRVMMVEDAEGELRLTEGMRCRVDELFVEIGGGPDINATAFRGALVHLGIVVSDGEASSMFEAADSDSNGVLDREEFAATIAGVLAPLVELRRESAQDFVQVLPEASLHSLQSLQTDILDEVLDEDERIAEFIRGAAAEVARAEALRRERFPEPPAPAPPVPTPVVVVEAPAPKKKRAKTALKKRNNKNAVKKEPHRSPWHAYEKLRPALRPRSSGDALGVSFTEHFAPSDLDAELTLLQGELRSRLAPATEDEWRHASDVLDKDAAPSKWSARFQGMASLRRNDAGLTSANARAETAAGLVGERFPLTRASSPRRLLQSRERDACFKRLACLAGGWRLAVDFVPPVKNINEREARLLRRCGRVADLDGALRATKLEIVYRGRLSSVKLAEALREVLQDTCPPDDFFDDAEGPVFRVEDADAETVEGLCRKLSADVPGGREALAPEHFLDLVTASKAFYGLQPLRAALDNGLLAPMDRPGPLCWANMARPGDGLARNPGPKSTWRSMGKKKKKKKKKKPKRRPEPPRRKREFALNDDETALRLRGDLSVNNDSLEDRAQLPSPVMLSPQASLQ